MSSKTENILLIPGPEGWDVWAGTREQGFKRELESSALVAADLEQIPKGKLVMGFPVREALAVPFKVQTEDEAMFDDLAEMHLEKLGIRPELDAGRLTDVFPAGREDGQSNLLNIVLAAPDEDSMPAKAPQGFDISARFFPLPENAVTIWRELQRWVFAISSGGHLMYFQSLSGTELNADVVRDIRLTLSQLSLQGVSLKMDNVTVWTTGHSSDPSDEALESLGDSLGAEIVSEPKPNPILPENLSRIVPADVRAEQRVKAEKQQRNLIIAAILVVYLGLVGYFGYGYWKLNKEVAAQEKELKQISLEHSDIGLFNQDWADLGPLVNDRNWPLQALLRGTKIIPSGQAKDVRFKVFEANSDRLYIAGEATDIKQASALGENLKKKLPDYDWNCLLYTSPSPRD